jgi:hypothetical protein
VNKGKTRLRVLHDANGAVAQLTQSRNFLFGHRLRTEGPKPDAHVREHFAQVGFRILSIWFRLSFFARKAQDESCTSVVPSLGASDNGTLTEVYRSRNHRRAVAQHQGGC